MEEEYIKVNDHINYFSHLLHISDLTRPVTFSDVPVKPLSVLHVEGDSTSVFPSPEYDNTCDAVVTLFFLDTARNLIAYLETIQRVLEKGEV